MHGLTVYVKEGLHFAHDLMLGHSGDSSLFSIDFTLFAVLPLFLLSIAIVFFVHHF